MEYFYIISSIASLVAFSGYIIDRFVENQKLGVTYTLLGAFVGLSVLFWSWFYFVPSNLVRSTIENRTYAVSTYSDNPSDNNISIVQGEFETRGWQGNVFLPPFKEAPQIFLKRPANYSGFGTSESPRVQSTTDSFTYEISNSQQAGTWAFRARGKLLTGGSSP